jgi:hypothetical protein
MGRHKDGNKFQSAINAPLYSIVYMVGLGLFADKMWQHVRKPGKQMWKHFGDILPVAGICCVISYPRLRQSDDATIGTNMSAVSMSNIEQTEVYLPWER